MKCRNVNLATLLHRQVSEAREESQQGEKYMIVVAELAVWASVCDLERFRPSPSRHLAVADVAPCEPALHPRPQTLVAGWFPLLPAAVKNSRLFNH